MNWIERATRTLELESQAIAQLVGQLDGAFEAVGQLILDRPGRVIMTGIGKSAIIAQKLVATFNSTGTPAVFMHAADAIHGDLGLVQSDDVVLCISKSGNSPEIKALTPLIKSRSIPLIGMVGNDRLTSRSKRITSWTPPYPRRRALWTWPQPPARRLRWPWATRSPRA